MIGASVISLGVAAALMAFTQEFRWWTPWGYLTVLVTIAALFVFAGRFYAQATDVRTVSSVVFQCILVSMLVPIAMAGLIGLNAVVPLHLGKSNEAEWAALLLAAFTTLAGYIVTPIIGGALVKRPAKSDTGAPDGQT